MSVVTHDTAGISPNLTPGSGPGPIGDRLEVLELPEALASHGADPKPRFGTLRTVERGI